MTPLGVYVDQKSLVFPGLIETFVFDYRNTDFKASVLKHHSPSFETPMNRL